MITVTVLDCRTPSVQECSHQTTRPKLEKPCATYPTPTPKPKPPFKASLDKTGKHGVALGLVAVTELIAKSPLLAAGPAAHVDSTGGNEDNNSKAAADQDDTNPSEDLKHVVGAGNQVATNAVGDTTLSAAGLAEAGQVLVDNPVANLADGEEGNAEVVKKTKIVAVSRRTGAVDVEGAHEAGKEPVEGRVAEDVGGGHGVGRELVDEEGLVLALEEMEVEEGKEEPLDLGHGRLGLVLVGPRAEAVNVWAKQGDEDVEENGAEVFDHEDGAPGDLGACGCCGLCEFGRGAFTCFGEIMTYQGP